MRFLRVLCLVIRNWEKWFVFLLMTYDYPGFSILLSNESLGYATFTGRRRYIFDRLNLYYLVAQHPFRNKPSPTHAAKRRLRTYRQKPQAHITKVNWQVLYCRYRCSSEFQQPFKVESLRIALKETHSSKKHYYLFTRGGFNYN